MNDCYQILGITRSASVGEIRAAFLARMKICHPDSGRADAGNEAAALTQAYWQLRDAYRRAEHDRLLFGPPARARSYRSRRGAKLAKTQVGRGRSVGPVKAVKAKSKRRPPQNRKLEPLRAAAGVAACSLAIVGFALAGTHFGAPATPQAQAAVPKAAAAQTGAAITARSRREIDAQLAESAADEFRIIVARSGLAGAHLYARQCLMELTARPTMTMLDHCMAFDDQASAWEENPGDRERESRRYFASDQRYGRYASIVREIAPGPVRESLLADVSFFAEVRD